MQSNSAVLKIHRIFLSIFILAGFSSIQAQVLIKGKILSSASHEPVPGANIRVADAQGGTITDEAGYYRLRIEQLPTDLKITHIAYQTRTIHVVSGGNQDYFLKPKVLSGQEVLITANRAIAGQTPVAFSRVDRGEIRDRYNHQDVPMFLNEQPGVYAYSDAGNGVGYTYVNIRGFKQDRIGVMLNGIPLNDPEAHAVYWVDHGDILASAGEIQIQRGVGNALYGAATFGGSINMVTRIQDLPPGVTVNFGYGNYLQSGARLSLPSEKASVSYSRAARVGGSLMSVYGRLSRLKSAGYRLGSGTNQLSGHLALEWNQPTASTRFELFSGAEVTHFAWDGVIPYYGYDLNNRSDRRYNFYADPLYNGGFNDANKDVFRQWIFSLKHLRQLGNGYLGTTLYYVDGRGYYEQYKGESSIAALPAFLRLYNLQNIVDTSSTRSAAIIRRKWLDNGYFGVISQYTLNLGALTTATGFDYRDYAAHHYGQVHAGLSSGIEQVRDLDYYNDHTQKRSYTLFEHTVYQVEDNLSTLLNLRLHGHRYIMDQGIRGAFDGSHDFKLKYDFFDWQTGFHYQLTPQTGSYASVATSQREPAAGDIFEHDDPDTPPTVITESGSEYAQALVKPEKLIDYELGVDWHNPTTTLNLNLYWMDFRNELIPVEFRYNAGSDRILHANAKGTIHRGIELAATYEPLKWLKLSGNTTLSDSYFKSFHGDSLGWGGWGGIADYSGKRIPGAPAFMANLRLKFQFQWGAVWLSSRTIGKQYIDFMNREDAAIAGYTIFNSGLKYRLPLLTRHQLTFSFWVNNLTDKLYETFGYNYFDDPATRVDVYWPAATRNWFVTMSARF